MDLLDAHALDARPSAETWTIREIVHHVSGVVAYAQMMGASPAPERID